MTNAWTLVLSSDLNIAEVEAIAFDTGKGDIRIVPPDDVEEILKGLEIGPLSTPDFTLWTHDYIWTPDRHGSPFALVRIPRHPELWAIDRAQQPTGVANPPEPEMKAVHGLEKLIEDYDLFDMVDEDRAEFLATAPIMEPIEGGAPQFNIGLVRIGERIETMMPADRIVDGNVDLSLLIHLARHDNAAKRLRYLIELRESLKK